MRFVFVFVFVFVIVFVFQTYSVRRVEMGESRSVYVTLAFAGVALMVRSIKFSFNSRSYLLKSYSFHHLGQL